MYNKIMEVIRNNYVKVFIQIILNTFYLFFIFNVNNTKLMYISFYVSVLIQIISFIVLAMIISFNNKPIHIDKVDKNVTNNKFFVVPEQNVKQLKKNNK
jgi:hypothetical protein